MAAVAAAASATTTIWQTHTHTRTQGERQTHLVHTRRVGGASEQPSQVKLESKEQTEQERALAPKVAQGNLH